jgi:hypothetical protein
LGDYGRREDYVEQAAGKPEYIENIRILNERTTPLRLVFEPWVSEYDIPPGEHVIVSSRGPIGDGVEISIAEEYCTVWGWPGSATAVVHNGKVVIDWRELRVPPTPVSSLREMAERLWADVKEADLEDSGDR